MMNAIRWTKQFAEKKSRNSVPLTALLCNNPVNSLPSYIDVRLSHLNKDYLLTYLS